MKKRIYSFTAFLLWVSIILSCSETPSETTSQTSLHAQTKQTFVGKESCKECHQKEYDEWKGSDHDLAMMQANDSSVVGDFNNVTYKSKGITYRFFKKGKDFYVNTEGENGEYKDFKIAKTFGIRPLQQYLIDFSRGRKQCLTVAWDTRKKRWFDVQPEESIHPGEWMHWTGGSMTWNNMCADCHSTNLHKNYDPQTESYHTTYSEINVACEACHGPASAHVDYYKHPEKYKNQNPHALHMDATTVGKNLVDKCARCHARRSQLTNYYDYQGHFLDHYKPALIAPPEYELDGRILDEDYVYDSFIQSKMYHYGVSCRDCHNMHTLKLKKQGNDLCLQCHDASYNGASHHFHSKGSKGAQCINCHMTGRYYMGVDFRRDHSFRIPRPDQSIKYGTPNACTKCHKDKTDEWAQKSIKKHYKKPYEKHFSDDLLAGYHNYKNFNKVVQNHQYPDISRATALSRFANANLTNEDIEQVMAYLKDSAAMVRNEAILGLDKYNSNDIALKVEPLLSDSIRLVRISAARYFNLHNLPIDTNSQAHKEYLTQLKVNSDFASGQHQLALYYQAKGEIDKAIEAYKKALIIDNYFNMARMNLALLYYRQGKIEEAKKLYLKVIEQEPEYSYPYYMLGLLFNETGKKEMSIQYLAEACKKTPFISRAYYNYALQLQSVNQHRKAVKILDKALQKAPYNEDLLYVKLISETALKKFDKAQKTCKTLLQINPENPTYQKIWQDINN